ncbi:hypothetical protein LCM17_12930 [Cereibacter sphaeroides]|nr:hypothetical protein [Cereibacter sphaeroides]
MAQITGTVTVRHEGRAFGMRLTFLDLATLQDEFGAEFDGIFSGTIKVPRLALMLRAVQLAVVSGTAGIDEATAQAVANAQLSDDIEVFNTVFATSFPKLAAKAEKADAPGNRKRAVKG